MQRPPPPTFSLFLPLSYCEPGLRRISFSHFGVFRWTRPIEWSVSSPLSHSFWRLCIIFPFLAVVAEGNLTVYCCFYRLRRQMAVQAVQNQHVVESSWNVMAHGWRTGGEWGGNWRMEWVASTLHTTLERGVSIFTTTDAHTSAVSSRLNWRPRRFKWTRPFRRKTKSGFCACVITFQLASTTRVRHVARSECSTKSQFKDW